MSEKASRRGFVGDRRVGDKGKEMPATEFELRADDGERLLARRWLPEGRPRAAVQIAHGLAEHSARYARFAAALNAAGYAAYANDHRGHGPKAKPADRGHLADERGWAKTVGDLWTMNRLIAAEQPGSPIVLFGHSMGSFLAQAFVAAHSDALAGAIYSGSNGRPPAIASAGRLIARAERMRLGGRGSSRLIHQLWFGAFNKPFSPARTEFDWLSRDEKEVDAYVADPHCGFPFTTQLAIDLLDALPDLSSAQSLSGIPQGLPDPGRLGRARSGRRQHCGPHRRSEVRRPHPRRRAASIRAQDTRRSTRRTARR